MSNDDYDIDKFNKWFGDQDIDFMLTRGQEYGDYRARAHLTQLRIEETFETWLQEWYIEYVVNTNWDDGYDAWRDAQLETF